MGTDAQSHLRRLVGALIMITSAVLLSTPAARAEVRTGSMQFTRPANPPSLTPQPPETQQRRYTQAVDVSYDDLTGSIGVHLRIYDAPTWTSSQPSTQVDFYKSCPTDLSDYDEEPSGLLHVDFSYYHAAATDYEPESTDAHATLTRSGYQGSIDGSIAPVSDGFQITFPAAGTLTGIDLRCFSYQRETQWLNGYEPFVLTKRNASGWFKRALADRYGSAWTDASETWAICPSEEYFPDGSDGGSPQGVICMAQFKSHGRYRIVDSVVEQTDTGPTLKYFSSHTWKRQWRKLGPSCARSAYVKGTVWSNDGLCPGLMLNDLDYTVRTHKKPGTVGYHGTNRAGFTTKVAFRCKTRARAITCTNRLGDAFRWTPKS